MENQPAILIGGEIIALAVARSLGRRGIPIHAAGDPVWDYVRHSRYCTTFTPLRRDGTQEDLQAEYFDFLERGPRTGVLLPCDDAACELVARRRSDVVELGYLPFEADDDALLAMLDKDQTYERARAAGVPTPATATVRSADDANAAVARLAFPCALKPVHSHRFAEHFGTRQKVWLVHDRAELERQLARMLALGLDMLVTEIVPGPDDDFVSYYGYLDESGRSLLQFTKRKLRQYPARFGLGSYHVTGWNEEVAEVGLRFLQGAGVRGLANVEFKRDERDGQLKLIECNHRLTAATGLVHAAGIDLALFLYNRIVGLPTPPVDSFRDGVRLWHPVEDVKAFLQYRRSGELSFARWAASLMHRQTFPILSFEDPEPALRNYGRKARVLRTKVAERRLAVAS